MRTERFLRFQFDLSLKEIECRSKIAQLPIFLKRSRVSVNELLNLLFNKSFGHTPLHRDHSDCPKLAIWNTRVKVESVSRRKPQRFFIQHLRFQSAQGGL